MAQDENIEQEPSRQPLRGREADPHTGPTTADQNATAGESGVEPTPESTAGDGGGVAHGQS